MLRFFFFCSFIGLSINALNAQTELTSTERLSIQELPPAEAKVLRASNDVDRFSRNLAALKTAFSDQNASRISAYEANIFQNIRTEITSKTANADQTKSGQETLEHMNVIFADLQEFSFDLANPQAAANAFVKLDAFLGILQSELNALKAAKK